MKKKKSNLTCSLGEFGESDAYLIFARAHANWVITLSESFSSNPVNESLPLDSKKPEANAFTIFFFFFC